MIRIQAAREWRTYIREENTTGLLWRGTAVSWHCWGCFVAVESAELRFYLFEKSFRNFEVHRDLQTMPFTVTEESDWTVRPPINLWYRCSHRKGYTGRAPGAASVVAMPSCVNSARRLSNSHLRRYVMGRGFTVVILESCGCPGINGANPRRGSSCYKRNICMVPKIRICLSIV
jgi:hypothetical protein